ncbi:hypothetical protein Tco_1073754 [Tanacetum coccineum]
MSGCRLESVIIALTADVPSSVTKTTDTTSTLQPPPPPLQKPTVHRDICYKDGKVRSKCENKGIVSTEMELVLEYTQQGASHEVSNHLKMEMEMEIPSSSNVKLITECSDTTYTCYEVMKDLIKVSKLPQTLISYSSSRVHKMVLIPGDPSMLSPIITSNYIQESHLPDVVSGPGDLLAPNCFNGRSMGLQRDIRARKKGLQP